MFLELFFLILAFFAYIILLIRIEAISFKKYGKLINYCFLPEEIYFFWFFVFAIIVIIITSYLYN